MSRLVHLALLSLSGSLVACTPEASAWDGERELPALSTASPEDPFEPLPEHVPLDPRRVGLGARLFRERLLSKQGDASCLDCHRFDHGGADRGPLSQLPGREPTALNSLSIFNLAFADRFNWNGYYRSLEAQLDAPMTNPRVMGQNLRDAATALRASGRYDRDFEAAYVDGLNETNLRDAIATYERSLVTPNAPFDRFLRGDRSALADQAFEGYRLFKTYGCASCHQGRNVGGNMVQKLGVLRDYFADRGEVGPGDLGLAAITQREGDRFVFRVPSLRNVALTAPYLHDGSAETLEDAVEIMAEYQLGRFLSTEEVAAIVAFLQSLTGEQPGAPR
jgi:cytochrome c peroxidase